MEKVSDGQETGELVLKRATHENKNEKKLKNIVCENGAGVRAYRQLIHSANLNKSYRNAQIIFFLSHLLRSVWDTLV